MSVIRLQWMRNKEAGQEFGNQEEIRPLTAAVFKKEVLPKLRVGFSRTLADYQEKIPLVTHYSTIRHSGEGPWKFNTIGPAALMTDYPNARKYATIVEAWDSPEALEWGRTADSDVYPSED